MPPSRNLVQRSSARRPSFHPYSHGRASLPHAGSQHTPPTTSRDMSHSVDPVEAFFGHQAIPGGPQDTQALDAAVNNPLSVTASEAGAFLQVTPLDFPGVADLAVTAELAVTTEATHGALLPLQRTTSLSSSGCLDSVLVQDMLLSAAGHFPYEGDVGLNQTKENCINVAGTVESGTGRDKVNTSAAFEVCLAALLAPFHNSPIYLPRYVCTGDTFNPWLAPRPFPNASWGTSHLGDTYHFGDSFRSTLVPGRRPAITRPSQIPTSGGPWSQATKQKASDSTPKHLCRIRPLCLFTGSITAKGSRN